MVMVEKSSALARAASSMASLVLSSLDTAAHLALRSSAVTATTTREDTDAALSTSCMPISSTLAQREYQGLNWIAADRTVKYRAVRMADFGRGSCTAVSTAATTLRRRRTAAVHQYMCDLSPRDRTLKMPSREHSLKHTSCGHHVAQGEGAAMISSASPTSTGTMSASTCTARRRGV